MSFDPLISAAAVAKKQHQQGVGVPCASGGRTPSPRQKGAGDAYAHALRSPLPAVQRARSGDTWYAAAVCSLLCWLRLVAYCDVNVEHRPLKGYFILLVGFRDGVPR